MMSTGPQGQQDEVLRSLARMRSALLECRLATQHALAKHERTAAWYARQGDQAAALVERHAAAVQRQRLADAAAALHAVEAAVSATLDQLDR